MVEPQKVAVEPLTGAHGDGVKTKNGCENVISGQNPPFRGVVNNYFSEKSFGVGPLFFAILPEKKSDYTVTGGP